MSSPIELEARATEVAETLKLLAHPKRLLILCQLSRGPKTVTELEKSCQISQSQLSQFLSKMRDEGIVTSEKSGHFVSYEIASPEITHLLQTLSELYCNPTNDLCH